MESLIRNGLSLNSNLAFLPAFDHVLNNKVPGCFCDIGCWTGTIGFLMAAILKKRNIKRKIYLFDTFSGHIVEQQYEIDKLWKFKSSNFAKNPKDKIIKTFMDIGYSEFELIEGDVCKTLKRFDKLISFASIDLNYYFPTKTTLELIYNNLSDNAIIFEDDYNHIAGITKAYDESNQYIKHPLLSKKHHGEYFIKNGNIKN